MTREEYEAWQKETESSKYHWKHEECFEHNRDLMIFAYIGGENGNYIEVTNDGLLTMGRYEGAIPHLGEADFKVLFTSRFNTGDEAWAAVVMAGGQKFLLDILDVPTYI